MTAGELIVALQGFDPDLEVFMVSEGGWIVEDVREVVRSETSGWAKEDRPSLELR